MNKFLLSLIIVGLLFRFYQPTLASELLNPDQGIVTYKNNYHPNYFVMDENDDLDSMVQFCYHGNDSSFQLKIQYKRGSGGSQNNMEVIQFKWNNGWQETIKNEYTYNSNGELMKSETSEMDASSSQWVTMQKQSVGYKKGKRDENVSQQFDPKTNKWKNAYKYEYEFSSNDSISQQLMYCWNEDSSAWIECQKHEYFYNHQNCIDSTCQYQWDSVANKWAHQYKHEYLYNIDNQLEREYQFCYDSANCQWDSSACKLYEYKHEHLHLYEYCTYDSLAHDWNYEWKHEYFYNGDGKLKQLHRYKHSSLKSTASDWQLDTKDIYYYANESTSVTKTNELAESRISFYPNPATDKLTIEVENPIDCRLQVYNITGKIVYQSRISSNRTIVPLTDFKAGLYLFSINNNTGIKTNKILIR